MKLTSVRKMQHSRSKGLGSREFLSPYLPSARGSVGLQSVAHVAWLFTQRVNIENIPWGVNDPTSKGSHLIHWTEKCGTSRNVEVSKREGWVRNSRKGESSKLAKATWKQGLDTEAHTFRFMARPGA